MRLVVVFAMILELQQFGVFADPKSSYKEPLKDSDSPRMYKVQPDPAWIAAASRRGFLPSSISRDYATRYQPRTPSVIEGRYRPREYSQPGGSSDYMQRRDESRPTCFQRERPEIVSQRHTQVVYQPQDSKNYRQFSASPRSYSQQEAQTQYNSPQTPHINSEGYQVVNEDPGLHTVVVSSSDQYSQPQVVMIRDNGQGYTSKVSQYRSQGPAIAYEYAEASRGSSSMQNVQAGSERRMSYTPQDQQPEMQYRSRHSQQKSMPYVVSSADSSHRVASLSNRQVVDIVNQ